MGSIEWWWTGRENTEFGEEPTRPWYVRYIRIWTAKRNQSNIETLLCALYVLLALNILDQLDNNTGCAFHKIRILARYFQCIVYVVEPYHWSLSPRQIDRQKLPEQHNRTIPFTEEENITYYMDLSGVHQWHFLINSHSLVFFITRPREQYLMHV